MLQFKAFLALQPSLPRLHPTLDLGQTPGWPLVLLGHPSHQNCSEGFLSSVFSCSGQDRKDVTPPDIKQNQCIKNSGLWSGLDVCVGERALAAQASRQWTSTTQHSGLCPPGVLYRA